MAERTAIIMAAENGDLNAINALEQSTHIEYVPAEKKMKVNFMYGCLSDHQKDHKTALTISANQK